MKNFFEDFEQFFNEFDGFFKFKPIKVLGETKTEKGTDSSGDWVKQTYASKDGSYQITTFFRTSNKKNTNESSSEVETEVSDLQNQLEECVKNQEFEKAAELRDKIKSINENQKHLESLKKQMDEAVKNQEFEKAAKLRDQIKNCQM